MAEVKFGVGQIQNPTPSKVILWVRVYTVVAAIFLGWMATFKYIGPNTKDLLNGLIGLSLAIFNGVAPLFGVNLSGSSYVKATEVTAMDSDPKLPYSAPGDKQINK